MTISKAKQELFVERLYGHVINRVVLLYLIFILFYFIMPSHRGCSLHCEPLTFLDINKK